MLTVAKGDDGGFDGTSAPGGWSARLWLPCTTDSFATFDDIEGLPVEGATELGNLKAAFGFGRPEKTEVCGPFVFVAVVGGS